MDIDELLREHEQESLDELRAKAMQGLLGDLEPVTEAELPATFRELHDQLIEGLNFYEELGESIEKMKQTLYTAMESAGIKKWSTDKMSITYVAPSYRTTFDSKRFKKEHEDLFDRYQKTNESKGGVRITIKKAS